MLGEVLAGGVRFTPARLERETGERARGVDGDDSVVRAHDEPSYIALEVALWARVWRTVGGKTGFLGWK